jgi:elongation factor P
MGIKALHLKRGMGVRYEDQVWTVWNVDHVVKGKGGSIMQIDLRNVRTGQIIGNRYRTTQEFDPVMFDRKKMEYLYTDSSGHVVMDPETYDQLHLPAELIGEGQVFLAPNIMLEMSFVEGQAVQAELPNTVELTVEDTPPQVKGATATNQLKEAVCEGGARVKVPPFVEIGTVIKVDTRTGEYLGRA